MPKKYQLPGFLEGRITQEAYERWLRRKAQAHVKRDRKRKNDAATGQAYREAIHRAVLESEGKDWCTGEELAWELISSYNDQESKIGRRKYKAGFALLPTADHVGDGLGPADFRICAWRTNDAKNDLSYLEFVELCRRVVEFRNRQAANI